MKRTSISLPSAYNEKLDSIAQKTKMSKAKLLRRCLKRYQKKEHLKPLRYGPTISYNRDEGCKTKFYFYLTDTMHNYAQIMRFKAKISFSYLVFLALRKFLNKILQAFESRFKKKYFRLIDLLGESLHARIRFQHAQGQGISIVMHKSRAG